jgi:hypothetical protein
MKIRTKMKQLTALTMSFLFLLSFPLTTLAANSENPEQLINIVVSDDENQTIIAQVPQKYAAEYREKLKNDEFKQEQIKMMTVSDDERALPEGKIIAQKYLYKSDIKKAADRVKEGAFENFLTSMATGLAVEKLITLLGVSNPWGLVGAAVSWALEYIRVKPNDWWKDSLIMILDGQISSVRISHIQNLKPTYPAAWLILERMS